VDLSFGRRCIGPDGELHLRRISHPQDAFRREPDTLTPRRANLFEDQPDDLPCRERKGLDLDHVTTQPIQ
jgi:hypothetical protein